MRAAVGALIRKDLRAELRSFEAVPAMLMFTVSAFVLFHFGLDRDELSGDLAAGVFWVTLLLAAVLGMNRLFVTEREQGGFDAFLLAPVDRNAMFVAKALVLFGFLVLVEVVALFAFTVLLLGPGIGQALPELPLVLLLADAGLAIIGTLVATLGVQTRARDLIVPLLALPLSIPLLIAGANATAPLLEQGGAQALEGKWLAILALYDVVFGLLAYAVYDYLLED
ncbi:MAG: heme exporter protein [Solirubrobacteraceae bacterium]|jgi:heme exporter protein B|nr:heme exporter protein [Solirubrobacteraceae bacterium]